MIQRERLVKDFEAMAQLTAPGEGINRLAFTDADWAGRQYIIDRMTDAGLSVEIDDFGNVIGYKIGKKPDLPAVMVGSHTDSVPNGGNYDGVVGVLSAIEVIRSMIDDGYEHDHTIAVVDFMCEESGRFGNATLGSKAMRGELTLQDLHHLVDKQGISLYEALKGRNLNPDGIETMAYKRPVKSFTEIHIEQGPVLDSKGIQLGLVDCIAGLQRYRIQMIGKSNHAGSTPMDMRSDAVDASAKVISCISEWAKTEGGGTVATVGFMQVFPNALNTISGKTEWVLDCRSSDEEKIQHIVEKLVQKLEEVKSKTGVDYKIEPLVHVKPGYMNKELLEQLEKSCCTFGYSYQKIMSGATHDAHLMSEEVDTIMLFVPSKDGISHSPEESSKYEDLARAVYVVSDMISNLN